jgi:hypothetical protein
MDGSQQQGIEPYQRGLLDRLLIGILIFLSAQTLSVQIFGCFRALAWCWVAYVLMLVALAAGSILAWKSATSEEKALVVSPWQWWMPWVVIAAGVIQISLYATGMNDSLSYRIPRIYLWLQEGRICNTDAADWRINSMTTGWENVAIPFYSLNLPRLCRLINLVLWGVSYTVVHHFAVRMGADRKRARWIAMALMSTPCFMMQAPSTANDFFVCGLVLIALHFVIAYTDRPARYAVVFSLLALVLASNVKPQFMLLGLAWCGWLLFGAKQPCRQLNPGHWLLLFPLLFLVSPGMKLVDNMIGSGSIMGAADKTMLVTQPRWIVALANSIQFLVTQLQLPVMPHAGKLDSLILSLPGFQHLHALIPRFSPGLTDVPLIDNASFGLIHAAVMVVGCIFGFRQSDRFSRLLFCSGILMFLVASTQVSVSTLGRSFIGFTIFAFPVVIQGWCRLGKGWMLKGAALTGLLVMIINPSHPLWPCDMAEAQVRKFSPGLAEKIGNYNLYRKRADTGVGILANVPYGEPVCVLVRQITPIKNLWSPDWRAHRIRFVHHMDAVDFDQSSYKWLLIADKVKEQFPDVSEDYQQLTQDWSVSKQMTYYPNIKQGPEIWTLYRRPE